MITADGYSKDPGLIPEGIVVTWGKDMIEQKGGLRSFIRYFNECMKYEGTYWLQKCKNKPAHDDLLYVYVIVANRLYCRCYYGGYEGGQTEIGSGDGRSWSSRSVISWPRIILAGPVEKAPFKRELKGFQGFRYCTKLF